MFQRDPHAIAHEVPVGLFDDVAQMSADAEFDAPFGAARRRCADHAVLHFNGTTRRVDDAAELDDGAVAGALDDPAMMHGDRRVDQVAAQGPEPRQRPVLVGSGSRE